MKVSSEQGRMHHELTAVGLRAQATAAGLVQLCRELNAVGILDDKALDRIKGVIADEISLTGPRSFTQAQYRQGVCERLDAIFAGRESLGSAEGFPLPPES